MVGDKNQLVSSVQQHHYITINEIMLVKMFDVICPLSQINNVFVLPQPFKSTPLQYL